MGGIFWVGVFFLVFGWPKFLCFHGFWGLMVYKPSDLYNKMVVENLGKVTKRNEQKHGVFLGGLPTRFLFFTVGIFPHTVDGPTRWAPYDRYKWSEKNPISRVVSPHLTIYFRPFIGAHNSTYNVLRAHLVEIPNKTSSWMTNLPTSTG